MPTSEFLQPNISNTICIFQMSCPEWGNSATSGVWYKSDYSATTIQQLGNRVQLQQRKANMSWIGLDHCLCDWTGRHRTN